MNDANIDAPAPEGIDSTLINGDLATRGSSRRQDWLLIPRPGSSGWLGELARALAALDLAPETTAARSAPAGPVASVTRRVSAQARDAAIDDLNRIHFNGQGCGTHGTNACSNCFGPDPMSAREVVAHVLDVLNIEVSDRA